MDQNPRNSTSDNWYQLKLLYRLKIGVDKIVKQLKMQDSFLDRLKCCVENVEQQQELSEIYRDYRLLQTKFAKYSTSDVYNVICDLFMSFHQSSLESMLEDEDISMFDTNNADSQSYNDYNENSNAGMGGEEDDEDNARNDILNDITGDGITGYEQVFSTPDLQLHRNDHSYPDGSDNGSFGGGGGVVQARKQDKNRTTGTADQDNNINNEDSNGSFLDRSQPFVEGRFRCDFYGCTYSSDHKAHLINHQWTHNSERRYKCNIADCTYATNWSACLRAHQQNHSLEADHKCDFAGCTFATYTRDSLTRHKMQNHDPQRKFMCDYPGCSFRTYTKNCLNQHKIIHTTERKFKCHECHYSTKRLTDLNQHKLTHNLEPAYKCDFEGCSYGTNWLKCIKRHKATHHLLPPSSQQQPQQAELQQPPQQQLTQSIPLQLAQPEPQPQPPQLQQQLHQPAPPEPQNFQFKSEFVQQQPQQQQSSLPHP